MFFRARADTPAVLGEVFTQAIVIHAWDVYRHLIDKGSLAMAQDQVRTVLQEMVRSDDVPLDLVEQAMTWKPPGGMKDQFHGELFIAAARHGETRCLATLMKEDRKPRKGRAGWHHVSQAVLEAAQRGNKEVLEVLGPWVDTSDLSIEFSNRIAQADGATDGGASARAWRKILDRMGDYLSHDGLKLWADLFSHLDIPITQAKLREAKAAAWEGTGGDAPGKPARARPRV